MGSGTIGDGVSIRNANLNRSTYLLINADGSINIATLAGTTLTTSPPATSTVSGNGTKVTVTNAQTTIVAANTSRIGGFIQNLDAAETIYLRFGSAGGLLTAAGDASAKLGPGESLEFGQPGAIYQGAIVGITTGASVVCGVNEET